MGLANAKKRAAWLSACICLTLFLFLGVAFASGGGGHSGAHDSERLTDLFYRFVNFALLVIILFVVLRKTAVKDFFSARREEIGRTFEELKKERNESEARYQELEKRVKGFEEKKEEIIARFREEGIAEKERIIAEARKRSEQILAQTDLTIEREVRAARDRLCQEIVDVAAKKAQEMIAKEIADSDQDQMVKEFIERVEKLH